MDREIIGKLPDGSYGLMISLPGYDVKTANRDEIAFDSRWSFASTVHASGVLSGVTGAVVYFPPLPYVPVVVTSSFVNSTPSNIFADLIEGYTNGVRIVYITGTRLLVTNTSITILQLTLNSVGHGSDVARGFNYRVLRMPCQ
ncbi:MAG: hypothetical protein GC184_06030 [Rhizobiales bacterium]|nr:hypothetical protein [Hyphomicrobiales bacterium]